MLGGYKFHIYVNGRLIVSKDFFYADPAKIGEHFLTIEGG